MSYVSYIVINSVNFFIIQRYCDVNFEEYDSYKGASRR